jgi:hypothetical protein
MITHQRYAATTPATDANPVQSPLQMLENYSELTSIIVSVHQVQPQIPPSKTKSTRFRSAPAQRLKPIDVSDSPVASNIQLATRDRYIRWERNFPSFPGNRSAMGWGLLQDTA